MEVQITVEGDANKDYFGRAHGFSVNEILETRFWETQPSLKIGTAARTFSKSMLLDLPVGRHTVTYGVSAHSTTPWNTKIMAGDRVLVEGPNSYGNYLSVSFMVLPGGIVVPIRIPIINIPMPMIARIPPVLTNLRTRVSSMRSRTSSIFGR